VYVSLVVGKSIYSATLVFFLANTKMEQVVLSKSGIFASSTKSYTTQCPF